MEGKLKNLKDLAANPQPTKAQFGIGGFSSWVILSLMVSLAVACGAAEGDPIQAEPEVATETMTQRLSNVDTASGGPDAQGALLEATQEMQETQMSFNLQYLELQSQMQHENRSYTAVSNIMKTKHDTAKNSISNVR
ncbi:MAG TPA: hypothetical protein VFQ61_23185 [Polyangiaceae bacterium]|nr:hypothetical protein [Polyangiaceae bacterium]